MQPVWIVEQKYAMNEFWGSKNATCSVRSWVDPCCLISKEDRDAIFSTPGHEQVRPVISQIKILQIRGSTFLNYINFANSRIVQGSPKLQSGTNWKRKYFDNILWFFGIPDQTSDSWVITYTSCSSSSQARISSTWTCPERIGWLVRGWSVCTSAIWVQNPDWPSRIGALRRKVSPLAE